MTLSDNDIAVLDLRRECCGTCDERVEALEALVAQAERELRIRIANAIEGAAPDARRALATSRLEGQMNKAARGALQSAARIARSTP